MTSLTFVRLVMGAEDMPCFDLAQNIVVAIRAFVDALDSAEANQLRSPEYYNIMRANVVAYATGESDETTRFYDVPVDARVEITEEIIRACGEKVLTDLRSLSTEVERVHQDGFSIVMHLRVE